MRQYALLSLALCAGACSSSVAQQAVTVPISEPCYTVHEGNTLWGIAGDELKDPRAWPWIYDHNPDLHKPGVRRDYPDGWTTVMIHAGDRLCGFDKFGNLTMLTPVATATPSNLEPVFATNTFHYSNEGKWWWTPWWLLLIPFGLFLWWLWEELKKDPVRSRAPQRPGGVNTAEQIHQALAEQVAYQRVDIIEIVAGRGYGIAGVRYAGNVVRPRNLTGESGQGERMYRATVRREDGSLDELYTIMACGNDIRYDGLGSRIPGRGFNFVADEVVAQEPAPAATPEPAPAPIETPELVLEPTAAIEPIAEPAPPEATVDDGRVLIELKRAAGNLPSMLRLKGIDVNDVSLTIADRETTIRFTETPPRPTRKAK